MATVIQLKRSSTQNDVPTTSDLSLGELAVNTYHGRVYTEKNDGSASIVEVGSIPASLTINGAYSFPTSDGSSGQVLKTDGSGTLTFQNETGGGGGGAPPMPNLTSVAHRGGTRTSHLPRRKPNNPAHTSPMTTMTTMSEPLKPTTRKLSC